MEQAFKDMLMKRAKEQGNVDPQKLKAKADMMKQLSDMLGMDMKDGITNGMKKVTVASNSPEGLETGLDLAKKKLSDMPADEEETTEDDLNSDLLEEGSPEEESSESADEEIAELEKKIAELKAKKIS